jgi:hypothetical protein
MGKAGLALVCAAFLLLSSGSGLTQPKAERLPRIASVEIGSNREFVVNGKPFLPIMGWLQEPGNFDKLKAIGINTIAGYHFDSASGLGAGGTHDAAEYNDRAQDAGLYFISPYMPQHRFGVRDLVRSRNLLAWIQDDEPDLPKTVSDASVSPSKTLKVNPSAPLVNMLDGDPRSESVLDPMDGAEFTVRFARPVSIVSLGVRGAGYPGNPRPRDISFAADGKPLIRVSLQNTPEQLQRFPLPRPATVTELTVKVSATYPTKEPWGFISELQGYDARGANVFLSPVRKEPQRSPAETAAQYKALKAVDKRPVLTTFTAYFIHDESMSPWNKAKADALYPAYLKATDVAGFDVYPIYGYNMPEKLDWVGQGMRQLRAYAGPRMPLYQWIEVKSGGQFGVNAKPVTGVEIRHEVWQAIIGGATAIGYFTHEFAPFSEFAVPPENQRGILAINQQLQRLAPAILGPDAPRQPRIAIAGGLPAQLLAKQSGGATWIFAQNMDMARRGGRATISVDGLQAGQVVEVVDEGRRLTAQAGGFSDPFGPLAVHIYRIQDPGR